MPPTILLEKDPRFFSEIFGGQITLWPSSPTICKGFMLHFRPLHFVFFYIGKHDKKEKSLDTFGVFLVTIMDVRFLCGNT